MEPKKAVVLSSSFTPDHPHYPAFRHMADSFGYEVVYTDRAEDLLRYLGEDGMRGALFCDPEPYRTVLREALVKRRHPISLPVILFHAGGPFQPDKYVETYLPLDITTEQFSPLSFSLFKYLILREKVDSVSGMMNPELAKKLLSETAHAINNVLTGMQGYVELAQLNPDDRQLLKDAFDVVIDSAFRVRQEIKNLRAFIRVENPVIEQVNLFESIGEARELLKTQLRAKGVTVDVGGIDPGVEVHGDYNQLVQVFFNLLHEIIHNVEHRSTIVLRSSLRDHGVYVELTSDGYILTESEYASLERIFAFNEPVLKQDSQEGRIENRNVLSICNRIIDNFGGEIVLGRGDGGAVSYGVLIPLTDEPGRRGGVEPVAEKRAYEHIENLDMEILVVDDEEYVRNTMYYFFDKKGCRVTVAEDGEFGFRVAKEKPFDLIFMDYLMPKMGGVESARKILETNRNAKIVFITGRESIDEEELYRAGIYACIKKPFEMSDIFDIARKVALEKGIVD